MKEKQQLYRVKLNNPQIIAKDRQIDGYLGNWLDNGKICEYTRGEAIKKAHAFDGKIEKAAEKVVAKTSFKLQISVLEHTVFTDGTEEFDAVDTDDARNQIKIGKFVSVEAAREFMRNLDNIYGE
jgi:hypothetical protein